MNHTPITFPGFGLTFNPDRVAATLFGRDIFWYGIIIAFGFLLAVLYTYRRAKRFGIQPDDFLDMLLIAVPIAIVCLRIYYVVFNFSLYQVQKNGVMVTNWAAIVRIWDGGLAIYGGIIGALLTAFIFCRRKKIKFGAVADLGSLGLLIGQTVGRWGNFINREAFGGVTDLPWRMGLTPIGGTYVEVHPTFLYESLWNCIGFVLLATAAKKWRKFDGQIFLMYIVWYGFGRGLIEGLRTDSLYLFATGLRVSQVIGFVSCAVALGLLLYHLLVQKHSPEEMAVYRMEHPDGSGSSEKNDAGGEKSNSVAASEAANQNNSKKRRGTAKGAVDTDDKKDKGE